MSRIKEGFYQRHRQGGNPDIQPGRDIVIGPGPT